jgi:hypothetical protein
MMQRYTANNISFPLSKIKLDFANKIAIQLIFEIPFSGFHNSGVQRSPESQLLQLAALGSVHGKLFSVGNDDQLVHQLLHLLLHVLRLQGRPLRGVRQVRPDARMRKGKSIKPQN